MYVEKRYRQKDIAEMFGCSVSAVSTRLKKAGIKCRASSDYPTTQNVHDAWVKIGKMTRGRKLSRETKEKIRQKHTGLRKRTDYEFGGHEKQRADGYISVYVPDHPNSTKEGYVMKHILIMERNIGRYLRKGECVHHINKIKSDNRIENLKLMTLSEHMSMHMKERHELRRKLNA